MGIIDSNYDLDDCRGQNNSHPAYLFSSLPHFAQASTLPTMSIFNLIVKYLLRVPYPEVLKSHSPFS
jgi:hypothetical protein